MQLQSVRHLLDNKAVICEAFCFVSICFFEKIKFILKYVSGRIKWYKQQQTHRKIYQLIFSVFQNKWQRTKHQNKSENKNKQYQKKVYAKYLTSIITSKHGISANLVRIAPYRTVTKIDHLYHAIFVRIFCWLNSIMH